VLYLSYRPGPPLDEFIDYLWLIDGGQAPRLEKILPCGMIELVVNLKHNEINIHDPTQPERYRRFSGAVFSGTYSQSFICNALQHESIMGVHFKPGGATPFLNTDASELANTHANLADLWGHSGLELRERLCTAATPQQRFGIMQNALQRRLRDDTAKKIQMNLALKIENVCYARQPNLRPRCRARSWPVTKAVYSDIQFLRWARAKVVLSNKTISASACFGGKAGGAGLGCNSRDVRLFRSITFN
jgi:hypothetical protein